MPGKAIILTASLHLLKALSFPWGLTPPELFHLHSPSPDPPLWCVSEGREERCFLNSFFS